jgi:16S rRNA G1207 methylase RsmC
VAEAPAQGTQAQVQAVAPPNQVDAEAAYREAVAAAVAAKWRYEAAVRAAVAAKWRYEAAIRAAVIAKWQEQARQAAYIEAIKAAMRAQARFYTSEQWASGWKAQSVIRCESGGNYSINTGNGYYGAWQFDYGTWHSNGGGQFAQYPHWASPQQQNYIAYLTWQRRGWQPWACA